MDVDLIEKLMLEKDEIISVCLQALQNVIHQNFCFSFCKTAEKMKNQWRESDEKSMQTLKIFLKDCVQITGNPQDQLYASDMYQSYLNYCRTNELDSVGYQKMVVWLKNSVPECVHKRIHMTGSNPKSGFSGIRLKNDYDE